MRLTRKCPAVPKFNLPEIYAPNIIFNGGFFPTKEVATQEIINKLGQLEDIEDELGIDLTIFIKFLKYGGYMKTPLGIEKIKIKDGNIDFKGKLFYVSTELPTNRILTFKDYGKTWALTKEELLIK